VPQPTRRVREIFDNATGERPARTGGRPPWGVLTGLGAVALLVVILLVGWISGYEKTNGGEIAVVRNGGPLDNHRIRQVVEPASGLVYTGMWSDVHKYPGQQRFYTISANPNEGDARVVDVVHVPTSDGVFVGIEGTLYFNLNTDTSNCSGTNSATLQRRHPACPIAEFDNRFGTRTFGGYHPYDGETGWDNFLAQVIRPVIDNNLREQIGNFPCKELVSSCALVQNQGNVRSVSATQGKKNNANLISIQDSINTSLRADLRSELGGDYLVGLRFILRGVTLPPKVQSAVDDAQAAFGAVSLSEAHVKQAALDAKANRIRESGYRSCPACARIDALKAIPPTVHTFAPGGAFAVSP
jgi:regulator of protease activity HflC (stomatin/prohibitin superfamily)